MKTIITLTDEELAFLQNLQNLINGEKRFGQPRCTLEDVIHECIKTVIFSGAKMTEDPENENGGLP